MFARSVTNGVVFAGACFAASALAGCFAGSVTTQNAVGESCSDNTACATGSLCVSHVCMKVCVTEHDCAKTEQCVSDVCAAGGSQCRADEDCATPPSSCHQSVGCWGGECRYAPKTVGAECPAPEERGPCATGVGACDDQGACVLGIAVGKTCTTPGFHGACATPNGTCSSAGDCVYGAVEPGTVCTGDDPCRNDYRCAASGQCEGKPVVCDAPPEPSCASADTLLTYAVPGECRGGTCWYEPVESVCKTPGSCSGQFPPCLEAPCTSANITCPAKACRAKAICYQGYCAYGESQRSAPCDANADGSVDGICNAESVCDADSCLPTGATKPAKRLEHDAANDCHYCDPANNRVGWSSLPLGSQCKTQLGADGLCVGLDVACSADVCFINGQEYARGAASPASTCQFCNPDVSRIAWTAVADSERCAGGVPGLCIAGVCQGRCLINGLDVSVGARSPANVCLECDPARSLFDWSPLLGAGQFCITPAGAKGLCAAGSCTQQCYIDGAYRQSGELDSGGCSVCDPDLALLHWATGSDGKSCTNTSPAYTGFCDSGSCVRACKIDGRLWAAGTPHVNNVCERCDPDDSLTSWSSQPDATPCGEGVCKAGLCYWDRCFIGGTEYPKGQGTACNLCDSTVDRFAWTRAADGSACGALGRCRAGVCSDNACYIAGSIYAHGVVNPSEPCQACDKTSNAWRSRPNGTACNGDAGCQCVQGAAKEISCADGGDNDTDGLTNCADPDCLGRPCTNTTQTVRLPIVADSYADQWNGDTNYGSSQTLNVSPTKTTYAKIDLTTLQGKSITSAVLAFSSSDCEAGRYPLARVDSAWAEGLVTWNNRPIAAELGIMNTCNSSVPVWDITSLVQGWASIPASNFGVQISTGSSESYFSARDTSYLESRPYLSVTFYPRACAANGACW